MSATVAAVTKLEPHPLAEKIPRMSREEYRGLRNDIRQNGQRFPITLFEGKVLDGRHRAEVCEELGFEPKAEEYDGDSPAAFVVSANLERRNLTESVRGALATEFIPALAEEARKRQGARTDLQPLDRPIQKSPPRTREEAATLFGVSGATVGRANRVKREAPEDFERVLRGETSVWGAEKKLRELRRSSEKPKPKLVDPAEWTDRQRGVAEAAERRIIKILGQCDAFADGFESVKAEQAAQNAPHEVAGWIDALRRGGKALAGLRKRLERMSSDV